jgi:hypothetical protein
MLLELRKRALASDSLTVEDVKTAYDDHVRNREAGMTSLTLRAGNDSGVGKLLQTCIKAPIEAAHQIDPHCQRRSVGAILVKQRLHPQSVPIIRGAGGKVSSSNGGKPPSRS